MSFWVGEGYLTHKRYSTHIFYAFTDGTSMLSWDTGIEKAPLHSKSLIKEQVMVDRIEMECVTQRAGREKIKGLRSRLKHKSYFDTCSSCGLSRMNSSS